MLIMDMHYYHSIKHFYNTNMTIDKNILNQAGLASSPGYDSGIDLPSCGKCVMCEEHLNPATNFSSTVTDKQFQLLSTGDMPAACTMKNIVYLITCRQCKFQYVGMTTRSLKERFYGHRSAVNSAIKHIRPNNILLYEHFSEPDHKLI